MSSETVARIRLALQGHAAVAQGIKAVETQIGGLKTAITGLAAGLTVGAFAGFVRTAIEAADAMSKTAAKTGLAVESVAGLQLAYRQSGLAGDALEKTMSSLSRRMAEGHKAFDAMGLSVRAADGSLKGVRAMLGEVADKFATYQDGAAKAALAQELFGKAGLDMIPLLNGGSDALERMDETARRLGLTLDAETASRAEQFNDTLDTMQQGLVGAGRQIAAALLPTLNTMAGELLTTANNTDTLRTASSALGTLLKGLFSLAAGGVQIFVNLGRMVGAAGAAIMAVLDGEFSQARSIMEKARIDNTEAWKTSVASITRVWDEAGNKAMGTGVAMVQSAQAPVAALGKTAKAVRQVRDEFAELQNRLTAQDAGISPTYYKELETLHAAYRQGRIDLDRYRVLVEKLTQSQKFAQDIARKRAEQERELANALQSRREAEYRRVSALADSAAALRASNDALAEEIKTMGLSRRELVAYTRAKLQAEIATKRAALGSAQNAHMYTREQAALEEHIGQLERQIELLEQRAQVEGTRQAHAEHLEMWASIDRTAHDVFVNIWEDGAGTFKRLGQTLKSALLDWLYQLTVKRWLVNISASFTGANGLLSTLFGGAGESGIDLMGLLNNAGTLQGAWGLISNWLGFGTGAGAGTLAAANAVGLLGGDAMGAFLAANGGWGTLGGGAAASSLAALGPIAIAAAAIFASLMDDSGTPHRGGAAFANSGGRSDRTWGTYDGLEVDHERALLPSRSALIAALRERGFDADSDEAAVREWMRRHLAPGQVAPDGRISDYGLYSILQAINELQRERDRARPGVDDSGVPAGGLDMEGLGRIVGDMRHRPDWYRGAGFLDPRELGLGVDYDGPAVAAARRVSEGILGSLERVMAGFGRSADFSVATGFADDSSKDGAWGALRILMDGHTLVDWAKDQTSKWAPREFADGSAGYQQYLRAIAGSTLDAFKELDLPKWAQAQIDATRAELDKLEGDKAGEQAAALIDRLTASMAQMATTIGRLIDVIPQFNGATQDMVHQLAEHFGGADQLGAAYNAFIGNFWSEDERRALMLRQIQAELSGFNVTLPDVSQSAEDARAQFRALVEGVDLTTEEGRKLFAALMRVQGAFAELTPTMNDAAEAARAAAEAQLSAARTATDAAMRGLESAIRREIGTWQTTLRGAQEDAAQARAVMQAAGGAARQLYGQSDPTRAMLARQGQDYITRALSGARAGLLPDAGELGRAIEAARGGLNVNDYASYAEYERAQLVLAGRLAEMEELGGQQLTAAERQEELAKTQINQLEKNLDYWRRQLELARGQADSLLSIDQATSAIAKALAEERAAKEAAAKEAAKGEDAAKGGGASGGGGDRASTWRPSTAGKWDEENQRLYLSNGGYIDYRTGKRHYPDGSVSVGVVPQIELDRFKREALRAAGVPGYARGTNYVTHDHVAIVHEGERILPAADNRALMRALDAGGPRSSGDAELRALRAEVASLRALLARVADASERSAMVLRNASDGDALQIREATA